jgi:hypothetical protein
METTQIVIGLNETLVVIVAMLSGFGFVWRASANAHKEIRGELKELRRDMDSGFKELRDDTASLDKRLHGIETDMTWIKHYVMTGNPPQGTSAE